MSEIRALAPAEDRAGVSRVVSMVFTDIEGSTALVDSLGAAYARILGRHQEIIRAAAEAHGGMDRGSQGDSFFLIFEDALGAVAAAIAAQRALRAEPWPDGVALRVRIGIHTGTVTFVDDEVVGLDVHRAARICDAGNGGQVVLSQDVQSALVASGDGAALDFQLRPLGRHRLKGLRYPETLFDVVAPGLDRDFAPVRALASRRDNLVPLGDTIIGRDAEIAEVMGLLEDHPGRVVTLLGPGGIGKSSLARRIAELGRDRFDEGVHVVDLGGVAEAQFALPTIAQVLGVRDFPGRSLEEDLAADIGPARRLLVLDTMEHVLAAGPAIARLVAACPELRVLVTSRSALGVGAERVVRVGPLALPEPDDPDAGANPSVRLFVARAQEVDPTFTLTDDNLETVAELVRRLEGVPLALELAAARLVLLTPAELLERLGERLKVLSSGKQDAGRHRTLRKAIEWSDDLLEEDERDAFHRLAVFSGGFRFRDAEDLLDDVEGFDGDAMDAVTSLVGKSLVDRRTVNGEPRFVMLDMIREFATEKLRKAGGLEDMRRRHCDHFAAVAETAGARALHVDQRVHVTRLMDELDNIRAAIDFALESGDAPRTARFVRALQWVWFTQAQLTEGLEWTARAAELARRTTDRQAAGLIHEAAAVVRMGAGDYAAGLPHAEAAVAAHAAAGDASGGARASLLHALCAAASGQVEDPSPQIMAAMEQFQADGDHYYAALGMIVLGEGARMAGMLEPAEECYGAALEQLEAVGDTFWKCALKQNIGHFRLGSADPEAAAALFAEAHDLSETYDYEIIRSLSVAGFAGVALHRGDPATAARFLGAVASNLDRIGVQFEPADAADVQRYIDGARAALGETRYDALAASGAGERWSEIRRAARTLGPGAA